jgi:hypothetical protein
MLQRVEVMRGVHGDHVQPFGPLPGYRESDVVAYEFELPDRFVPWPGRTRLERTFVLLDVGVSFANPCWMRTTNTDGSVVEIDSRGEDSWYVDLITVDQVGDRCTFRDLYIDAIVPVDGRHYRLLDLDEFADAMEEGRLSVEVAVDGLRRWQRFLDRCLHSGRGPTADWSDFPPKSIQAFAELPSPFAEPVRWDG